MALLGKLLIQIAVKGAAKARKQFSGLSKDIKKASTALKVGFVAAAVAAGYALRSAINAAGDFSAKLVGLRITAKNTGRDFEEVKRSIKEATDSMQGMATQADLTGSYLKLMGTSLSLDQIRKFVNVVRDGAAAQSEDFATQLELVTRGFKQLNPNVIDNIGINIRMIKVYKDLTEKLGKTKNQLTDVDIEQGLLNEILSQGAKFTGTAAAAADTYSGKLQQLNATIKQLKIELGEEMLPVLSDVVDDLKASGDNSESAAQQLGRYLSVVIQLNRTLAAYSKASHYSTIIKGMDAYKKESMKGRTEFEKMLRIEKGIEIAHRENIKAKTKDLSTQREMLGLNEESSIGLKGYAESLVAVGEETQNVTDKNLKYQTSIKDLNSGIEGSFASKETELKMYGEEEEAIEKVTEKLNALTAAQERNTQSRIRLAGVQQKVGGIFGDESGGRFTGEERRSRLDKLNKGALVGRRDPATGKVKYSRDTRE